MKKGPTFMLILSCMGFLGACSKFSVGASGCNKVVDNNLLQETYEENRRKPNITIADTGFCIGNNGKENDYCDIKIEVKDIKMIEENSFSQKCEANLRYVATFNEQRYSEEKKKRIDKIISDFNKAQLDAKDFVISTFEKYNASYNEEDINLGVEKRKEQLENERQEAIDYLNNTMPDFTDKKSVFEVQAIKYTASESNNFTNISIEDIKYLTMGE